MIYKPKAKNIEKLKVFLKKKKNKKEWQTKYILKVGGAEEFVITL